jgi:hypothetical protein
VELRKGGYGGFNSWMMGEKLNHGGIHCGCSGFGYMTSSELNMSSKAIKTPRPAVSRKCGATPGSICNVDLSTI